METQDASLIDLLEMRMGIECTAASLAAQRIDTDELEAIAKALAEMERDINSGGLGTEGDLAFHMAIAAATKNPLQIYIMKNVSDFLHMGIRENLLHLYQVPENIETIIQQHKAIFDAIRRRDPEDAYNAMRSHITFVIDFFSRRQ
jgi:DNA-binding FadR family transcriptional regulator